MADKNQRQHRATFSKNKYGSGYLIRVEGPHATAFLNRVIPVTRKDNTETEEKLESIVWSGKDQETGKPVCLYTFESEDIDPESIVF